MAKNRDICHDTAPLTERVRPRGKERKNIHTENFERRAVGGITDLSAAQIPGLSLRGGGQGFPPVTKNVAPGYFHRKIEEK